MWQKICNTKRRSPRWAAWSLFHNSTPTTTWWAFHKTYSQTKSLPKCKSHESAAKWSHNPTKNNPTWPITRKANAHSKTSNSLSRMPFSSNYKKRKSFLNWESTLICTSLASMVFWRMMLLSCWKKSGMSLWLMSLFWRLERAQNSKSTFWWYWRVICDFRDCFWQID